LKALFTLHRICHMFDSTLSMVTVCMSAIAAVASAQSSQHALRFYGTGTNQQDRVRIAIDDNAAGPDASAPCDIGAGSFTLDFWIRGTLTDNGSAHTGGDNESFDFSWINGNIVIDRDIWGGSDADWGVSLRGGFVSFGTGRGQPADDSEHTLEGDTNVLDGTWHHVAVTRDAITGIKRIFVDGQLDFSGSTGASQADISYPDGGVSGQVTPWGPYIVLAAEKHDAGPPFPSFRGYLDEVRIWNVALSEAQILASFDQVISPVTSGLVAYYRFEEGTGTAIADSSAAASPAGLLIAGTAGNGEWVSFAADPANTAPVSGRAAAVPAFSSWSAIILAIAMLTLGGAWARNARQREMT